MVSEIVEREGFNSWSRAGAGLFWGHAQVCFLPDSLLVFCDLRAFACIQGGIRSSYRTALDLCGLR